MPIDEFDDADDIPLEETFRPFPFAFVGITPFIGGIALPLFGLGFPRRKNMYTFSDKTVYKVADETWASLHNTSENLHPDN